MTTPQDGITSAFYDWAQLSCSTAISRKEERQNSGRSRLLNLLESKLRQTEVTMQEKLNLAIVEGRITSSSNLGRFLAIAGNLDSGASAVLPIPALIDSNNSRSVSIGNINGNTYSFWRNQAQSSTATTFAGMKQEMNNHYNDCSKGTGGSPNLMLGDQVAWEQYWNSLQSQERYVVTDQRVLDVLGGSDMLRFRGATFIWDEMVPDTETNATVVGGVGTVSASTIFFINSQTVEWVVDSSTDFIMTPFVRKSFYVQDEMWDTCVSLVGEA